MADIEKDEHKCNHIDIVETEHKTYIAIDLKSFYASVECVERGLDPLKAKLVVADESRTDKTICLAVSPALKAYGIPGRARLYEAKRMARGTDFIIAKPQMAKYMAVSTKIFGIYGKYVAPEDIHVYSIDEVFMDVTHYLNTYKMTPRDLAMTIIKEVLKETGITATAGIGTNLYLCKIAMDIEAKHMPADENGVRIAELDEKSYREKLWTHTPLTDFWRLGPGYAKRLARMGIKTMGDLARYSLVGSEKLYREFGINAELLIDHAWGWEPTEIADIKNYHTDNHSLSSGQVLKEPYEFEKARIVLQEMADALALDLVSKKLLADQIVLDVGYDIENVRKAQGEIETDRYGRKIPKRAHGSVNLDGHTSSGQEITAKTLALFDKITNRNFTIRRLNIAANHIIYGENFKPKTEQLNMFTDYDSMQKGRERERRRQKAILAIKKRYGKNSIMNAISYEEGATARERNGQVGGHAA